MVHLPGPPHIRPSRDRFLLPFPHRQGTAAGSLHTFTPAARFLEYPRYPIHESDCTCASLGCDSSDVLYLFLPCASGKPEIPRTMNLLPGVDAVGGDEESAANKDAVSDLKKGPIPSIELFPQSVDLGNKSDLNREPQAETAQMTIFYGGKVVIFDNFPADKAKELMMMAGRGTSPAVPPQRPTWPQSPPLNSAAARLTSISDSNKPVAGTAVVPSVAAAQEAQQKPSQTATSDLPIARRVSLHRFLEKRKDRISAKAPYQLNGAPGAPASFSASAAKPEESSQWLGLAPQVSIPEDLRR